MYDPFATPPPAVVPQVPQVMPNPTAVPAANNALAQIMNKHQRRMQGPNGMFPLNPGAGGQGFDPVAFHQAMSDWRGQRPDRTPFAYDPAGTGDMRAQQQAWQSDWRGARSDWRDLRPRRGTFTGVTTPPAL